jgi:ankyrin repeat protein
MEISLIRYTMKGTRTATLATLLVTVLAASAIAGEVEDTQLLESAQRLEAEGVERALKQGANPNALSNTKRRISALGSVALGVVASERDPNSGKNAVYIVKTLFQHGGRLGIYDQDILFFPIAQGDEELVALLIDHGASPIAKLEGYTPAELAIKYNKMNVYQLLVSRGAVPVKARYAAQTKLIEAVALANMAQVRAALGEGADINGEDSSGRTALIEAVRRPMIRTDWLQLVMWLLEKGADPNKVGDSGLRGVDGIPLHVAVSMNRPMKRNNASMEEMGARVIQALLAAGARVSAMDHRGRTPLHIAAEIDHLQAAQILIAEGARVMARDKTDRTPLDYAESKQMIQLLKKHGALER